MERILFMQQQELIQVLTRLRQIIYLSDSIIMIFVVGLQLLARVMIAIKQAVMLKLAAELGLRIVLGQQLLAHLLIAIKQAVMLRLVAELGMKIVLEQQALVIV